jgi:hypothetical protein
MNEFGLVNEIVVKWLRDIVKFVLGAGNVLDRWGFPVDAQAYIEMQLQKTYPDQNSDGLLYWIANNYSYFLTGDIHEVTKSINNFLLFDPKIISIFGYSIAIYSDPAHMRKYALYGAGAIVLYMMYRRKRK